MTGRASSAARERQSTPSARSECERTGQQLSHRILFARARLDAREQSHRDHQTLPIADPGIGVDTDVPYVDPEGALAGIVTVREVEDPFTGFREDGPPAEGSRFVQLTVAFEASEDMPFEAHPSHILLQDTDGFLWSYTTISRAPDAKPKELESQGLEAGDRVSGAIDFVIPASAVIDEVLYQPSSGGRLITVAGLSGTERPVAQECDGVEAWLSATIERLDRATELSQEDAAMDPAGYALHQPE